MTPPEQMEERRLIVLNDGKWFVRRVFSVIHDWRNDHKVYRCDEPICGPYEALSEVPEVSDLIKQGYRQAIEDAAKVATGWLENFGGTSPENVTPQRWANDAVIDIASAIRALKPNEGKNG